MSATTHVTVAGITALSLVLHVPPVGPWWADAVLDGDASVSGRVSIAIGDSLALSGTVIERASGVFAEQRTTRIVGGAGGWGTLLASRGYHDDSGVLARTVATDAATAAGETLGAFAPGALTIGVDYVRDSGAAAVALERAITGASWWVDFSGTTVVGSRSTSVPAAGSYQVLEFDPTNRIALLGVDDLSSIVVGSQLAAEERMPAAQTVRELRIEITADVVHVVAWCGELDAARGRLARSIESVVRRILAEKIYGAVRYRVMQTSGDRVELQAIAPGFPDIGPISYAPGVAGAHATLAVGAELLVEFIEGDRARPRVTHFAGKDGVGWTPIDVTIDASSSIKLGANATKAPAWSQAVFQSLTTRLAAAVSAWTPVANDGGAALKAALTTAGLTGPSWPDDAASLGATKTVCE